MRCIGCCSVVWKHFFHTTTHLHSDLEARREKGFDFIRVRKMEKGFALYLDPVASLDTMAVLNVADQTIDLDDISKKS